MFNQLSSLMKATLFYSITLGLILLLVLLGKGLGDAVVPLAMFTPLAAVLLMQFVVTRDGTTRAGWQILGVHRLGLRAWGFAILAPFVVLFCTYAIAWGTGIGRLDQSALMGALALDGPLSILRIVFLLLLGIVLGTLRSVAEEIGWRGYLLPQLLPLGQTRALLLSGLLQGIWHLPLILLTPFYHPEGNPWIVSLLFVLTISVAGVFYGYLRLTSNSVWPAALAHSAFNSFWSTFAAITIAVTSAEVLEYWAGESGVITLVEVALLGAWLLYRLNRKPGAVQMTDKLVGQPLAQK